MVAFGVIRRINENKQRQEYAKKCVHKWFDEHSASQDQSPTADDVIKDKKISECKDDVFTKQKISHLFPTSRNKEKEKENANVTRLKKCVASELRHLEQLEKDLIRKVKQNAKEFDNCDGKIFEKKLTDFINKSAEFSKILEYKNVDVTTISMSIAAKAIPGIYNKYKSKKTDEMSQFLLLHIKEFLQKEKSSDKKETLTVEKIKETVRFAFNRFYSDNRNQENQGNKTYYNGLYASIVINMKYGFEFIYKNKDVLNEGILNEGEFNDLFSKIQENIKNGIKEKIEKYVFLQGKFLNSTEDSIANDLKKFSELDEKLNFNALLNDPEMHSYAKETFRNAKEKRENFLKNDLKKKIKSSLSDAFDSMYIDPLNSEFKETIEFLTLKYEPYLFVEGENDYKDFEKNDLVKNVHAIFQEHRQGVNLDDGKPKFSDEEFKSSLKDAISLGIQEVEEKREEFLKDEINTCLLDELKSNDFQEFKKAIEFLKEKDTKKGYDFCFYPTDYSELYKNNAIIKNIHEILQNLKRSEQNGINPKYTDEEIKAILIKFFKSTWDIKNAFDIINDNKGKSEKEKIELVQKIILPKLRTFLLEKGILEYHADLIKPEEVPAILKMIEKLQSRPEFWQNCQIILSKITQETNGKGEKTPYDARTIWRFVNEVLSIENPVLLLTVMGKIQKDERTLLDFQVKTSSEAAYLEELKLLRGNPEKYERLKFSRIVGLYETAEWKKFEELILNFLKENENAKKIKKPLSTPMQVCENRENNETNANNPNPIGYNVIEPAPGLDDCDFDKYPHIQEEIFEAQAMLEDSCESMGPRHSLSMIGYLFLSHHAISLLQEARGIVWGIFRRYKDEMIAEITKNSSKLVEYKEFMDEISQKLSINNLWLYAMELAIKRRELAGPKCGNGILETWEKNFLKHIFSHYELENDGTSF